MNYDINKIQLPNGDVCNLRDNEAARVLLKTVESDNIIHIEDAAEKELKDCKISFEPIQNLNGYENPWPGGGSAQLLPTFLQDETSNGVTLKVNADGSVTLNGTATDIAVFRAPLSTWQWDGTEECWLSGCPSGGNVNTGYSLRIDGSGAGTYSNYDIGSGVKLASAVGNIADSELKFTIVIRSGGVCNNLNFKPMLNKGLSAQPFQPYSNICPITGWTQANITRIGKNLFGGIVLGNAIVNAVNKASHCFLGEDDNGKYVQIVAGNPLTNASRFMQGDFKQNTQYTFIISLARMTEDTSKSTNLTIIYTDRTTTSIQFPTDPETGVKYSFAVVTPANKTLLAARTSYNSGTVRLYYEESGLFEGVLTTNDFQPYVGQTYTITFPTEAGTAYGGTLDVTNGTLTVDRAMVDLGARNWTISNHRMNTINALHDALSGNHANCICSMYKSDVGASTRKVDMSICFANNGYIYVYDTSFDGDAATFKTAMSGVQLVYELATPITYQLTPTETTTLLGQNNIWTDTNHIKCTYYVESDLNSELGQYKSLQTPVSDPTADGNSSSFISSITQNEEGVITPTKANLPSASTETAGIVQLNNTLTSDSITQAATANTIKEVYELAEKTNLIKTIQYTDSITIQDAAERKLKSCKIRINPIQDLNGYSNPWYGGDGKNLANPANFKIVTESNGTYTCERNGYQADLYTAQTGTSHIISQADLNLLPTLTAGTYVWSFKNGSGAKFSSVFAVDNEGNRTSLNAVNIEDDVYSAYSFTVSETTKITIVRAVNTGNNTFSQPQLEKGTTRTAWQPYMNICPITGITGINITHSGQDTTNSTTYNIQFPAEAGTVYSGVLDLIDGILTVDKFLVTLDGTEGEFVTGTANYWKTNMVTSFGLSKPDYAKRGQLKSNQYYLVTTGVNNNRMRITANNGPIFIYDHERFTDEETAIASLAANPVQILYPAYTPSVYQLTPTQITLLLGQNNISLDAGEMELTYYTQSDMNTELDTKANKAIPTAQGNLAALDIEGNLLDTGHKTSQYVLDMIKVQPASTITLENCAENYPLNDVIINMQLTQEGEGEPSNNNVRSITNWEGLTVYHSGADTSDPDKYQIDWESTVGKIAKGTLNLTTGVLTVNTLYKQVVWGDGQSGQDLRTNTALRGWSITLAAHNGTQGNNVCSRAPYEYKYAGDYPHFYTHDRTAYLILPNDTPADAIVQFTYDITPIQYQLTKQEIKTLLGTNNIWTDTGTNITVTYAQDSNLINSLNTELSVIKNSIPTKTSDLTNDSNYLTSHQSLSNYVQKTNYATDSTAGLVQYINGYGIWINPDNGNMRVDPASSAQIKEGTFYYSPIGPARQHESVFYGLAKAAGDATQAASSNSVGTYTAQAKTAIRNLIGAVGTESYANSTTAGLVKYLQGYGVWINENNGYIRMQPASSAQIKEGTFHYTPVGPSRVHQAAFYGLAKAAGDTTQKNSSNAVGNYTPQAKAAILTMLGVQKGAGFVEELTGTSITINGEPNTRYKCGQVSSITINPPSAGIIDVIFTSGSTPAVLTLPSTVKLPVDFDASTLETNTIYNILITDGTLGGVMKWAV